LQPDIQQSVLHSITPMRQSATGRAQMRGIPVDVENTSTCYFTIPSRQEWARTIGESKTIKGVQERWRKLKLIDRRIAFLKTGGHCAYPNFSVVETGGHHFNVVGDGLGRDIGERHPPILHRRSGLVSAAR
jgi:hypothetical protein